jgi:hypothetical protein
MREVEIGCKVPETGGMEGFGVQEIADLISEGWRVVGIKPKGALMREMPSPPNDKQWGFVGFAMIVQFEEPTETKLRGK